MAIDTARGSVALIGTAIIVNKLLDVGTTCADVLEVVERAMSSLLSTSKVVEYGKDYYRYVYRDYDRQNPQHKLAEFVREIFNSQFQSSPNTIHDIGCAFGRFLGVLGPGWRRYGSDVSEYAIGRARQEQPECTFAVAEMGQVAGQGFPEKFAAVTAFDSIEHMPDLEQLAESVKAQLLPGGTFIFVVPVYDGLSGPIIRRLDCDPTHLHKWPRQRWLDWAGRHFRVVRWHGILRYLLPWGWYLHWPTGVFRWHTPAVMVVCMGRQKDEGRRMKDEGPCARHSTTAFRL